MIGRTISHYEIFEVLGGGGMGVVYKARDLKLDRHVALKFLPPNLTRDPQARDRFIHEAKAASALQHENICTVHDIDQTEDGQLFIVMDCYEGETLRKKIERGPLPVEEAAEIALQVARGLRKAHENGIVHRDIKPANLMVTADGVVKILDFGLAKLSGGSMLTASGSTMGTAAYMSPEQTRGEVADPRTDLWSLGVVLYEMLTGERPFKGEYSQVLIYSILNTAPPPISSLPARAAGLAGVVSHCLEKDPARRTQNAGEFTREMLRAAPWIPAGATSRLTRVPSLLHPRRRLFAATAVALLLVIVAVAPLRRGALRLLGAAPEGGETHLAVLVDASGAKDEPLSWGIVDVLAERIARLHRIDPSLWVIPSDEILKEKVVTASDAHKTFGATLAITVRAVRETNRIKLTMNLIDAISLRLIDSQELEDAVEALPALENKAREKAAALLHIPLSGAGGAPTEWASSGVPYDLYLQARGYLDRYDRIQNIDLAIELLLTALRQDTGYAVARAGLAEGYWRKYDETKDTLWVRRARQESSHAVASGTPAPEIFATAGLICNGTGDYVRAVSEYSRVLDLDPENAEAARGLGMAFERLNDPQRAEELYRKAVALQPASWGLESTLGGFLARQGRYADAIEPFRRVIALAPNNTRGYNNVGAIELYLGRYPEAEKVLKESIAILPTYAAYSNLGTAYYKERRFGDAASAYDAALNINDQDYILWGNLASASMLTPGRQDSAAAIYRHAIGKTREALAVNPHDPTILAALAGYYGDVGSRAEATQTIKDALALAPNDGEVLYRAGCVYEAMGDRPEALRLLALALEHGYSYQEIEDYPGLDALRKDPRFAQLRKAH